MHPVTLTLAVIMPVAHALGVVQAVHAIKHVRTSQGTIAWVIGLLTVPLVSVPLYGLLGRRRFHGYVEGRRREGDAIDAIFKQALADTACFVDEPDHALFQTVRSLTGLPATLGNRVELLIDGEAAYRRLFESIERAREYVLVLYFIIKSDRVGERFVKLLEARASEGVKVSLIYDEVGSRKLPRAWIERMRDSGVDVRPFGTTRGRGNRFQINFRNHRKVLVVDGEVGFVGGLNIGDEYLGKSERFGKWRDTQLGLQGPAVNWLQWSFLEDWQWAVGRPLTHLVWNRASGTDGDRVAIVPSGPADELETCHVMFAAAIASARTHFWVASPYFVPDGAIVTALQAAALRGVDVRILLPERPDHLLVYLSSFAYFDEMDAAGVKIYRYQPGFLHQKVFLIDDHIAGIGTANLDNRSFRLNFEVTAMIESHDFAAQVRVMLERDFEQSRQVDGHDYRQHSKWFRGCVRVARLFSPIQ